MLKMEEMGSTLYQAGHDTQASVSLPVRPEFGLTSESACPDFMVTSHVSTELNFPAAPQSESLDSVLRANHQTYLFAKGQDKQRRMANGVQTQPENDS